MRGVVPTVLCLLLPGSGTAAVPVAAEASAECSLELPDGARVTLRYRPRPHDAAQLRELRRNPEARRSFNDWFPTVLQGELEVSVPVLAGDVEIPAGTHRMGLGMNDAGALQLRLLRDQEFHALPLRLTESAAVLPYLCLGLIPLPEGLFQVLVQWGPETGMLAFRRSP